MLEVVWNYKISELHIDKCLDLWTKLNYLKLSNSCLQIKNRLLENDKRMRCEILESTIDTKSHNFPYRIRMLTQNSIDRF